MTEPMGIQQEEGIGQKEVQQAEEIIDRYEGGTRRTSGIAGWIITGVAVVGSLFSL